MRRPKMARLDPRWFEEGAIAEQTAVFDDYNLDGAKGYEDVLVLVMSHLIDRLPRDQREAVELRVFGGLSYRDAGAELECDPRTVQRRERRGLSRVLTWLAETPWLLELLADRLPPPYGGGVKEPGGAGPAGLHDLITRRLEALEEED